jgi:hypothetical protein
LQAEHDRVFVRFRVVVAEQVQDAVHAQQRQLVLGFVAGPLRLFGGDLRAEHHVAEQARIGARFIPGARLRRPELVHREREHIGRARLAHPAFVQLGHRAFVDEQHRQFGERVDTQLIQREPGDRGESGFIDLDA